MSVAEASSYQRLREHLAFLRLRTAAEQGTCSAWLDARWALRAPGSGIRVLHLIGT